MLPEFPDANEAIQSSLHRKTLDAHKEGLATFRNARKRIYHEGEQHATENDGNSEPSKFTELESGVSFRAEDLLTMTREDFEHRFAEMGKELGEKASAFHWQIIHDATERSGSVIKREKGESIIDSIFKMTEAAQMSFEGGGHGFTLYVPPSEYDAVVAAQEEIQENPDLANRMKQLMQTKHEQWRAEEANRKLVD